MRRTAVWLLIAVAAAPFGAHAHGGAGDREFPATLVIDDPAVKDEATLPGLIHQRNSAIGSAPANRETDLDFEFDKTITEHLGVGISDGYSLLEQIGDKRLMGAQTLSTSLKYQYFVGARHEVLSSLGVVRDWGQTGARSIGASRSGSTTPTLYVGKGLGDLPVEALRPFAVTATFGVQLPDTPHTDSEQAALGLSLQYSLSYLQEQVMTEPLPGVLAHLIPLVEFSRTAPITHGGETAALGTIAPGLIYSAATWQVGAEALIPATSATKTGTGGIIQFHVFLGDLFPETLGKPLL